MSKSKRLREDIHKFLSDEDYQKATACLRDGMQATHIVRRSRDDGQRGVEYQETVDHTTRMQAARLTLEYGFGKPATRHEINVNDDTRRQESPADVMDRLRGTGTNFKEILEVYAESSDKVEAEVLELEDGS
jgi:hypothetical protein